MITKSFSLFGKELYRVERDREGNFTYNFLNNAGFNNSQDYLKTSLTNPVIHAIISLRCKMYSQMKISHVDANGNEVKNSEVLKLLKSPNFFQSQQDFLFQLCWFKSAVGTNFVYQKKNALNSQPIAIYNLFPDGVDLNKVNKLDNFIATNSDFKDFKNKTVKYKIENKTFEFILNDIIPFYDLSNGLENNDFISSPSRLNGIKNVIENIEENIKSKNVNLKMSQKYLATNQGVSNGVVPQLKEDDRNAIERILQKKSMQVTNVPIDVKHLVSDFKRLFLDELFANDANTCLLAFEMSKDILNYFSTGSTFENQEQATLNWLQNSIQTDADSDLDSFSQTFGLFKKGEKLVASYNHLPIMQKVVKTKIEALKLFQETIGLSITNGLLTNADAKKMNDKFINDLKL